VRRVCSEASEACQLLLCLQAFPHTCDQSCSDAYCREKKRDVKCVPHEFDIESSE